MMARTLLIGQVLIPVVAAIAPLVASTQEQSVVQLTATGSRNRTGAWAPDGQQIVFGSNRTGTWQLWLMRVEGSPVRQLTAPPYAVGGPSWSKDGSEVWFESGLQLHRLLVATGESAPFDVGRRNVFRPATSPSGRRLLFDVSVGSDHDIWVYDRSTGQSRQLTADPNYDSDGRWSPDETAIVFHSDRGTGRFHTQVFSMSQEGTAVRQLTAGPSRNGYPAWSPNGRCIVYTSELDGNRDLWLMDRTGSNKRRLTTHDGFDGDPAWKPTGGTILFSTSRWGGEELALLALSAADLQQCEA